MGLGELKGGSVSEDHNFISLGVPKGHNPALDITINISSLYLMNILNPYKVTSVHLYMYIISHIPFFKCYIVLNGSALSYVKI